jgi:hypothetical protein
VGVSVGSGVTVVVLEGVSVGSGVTEGVMEQV